MVIANWTEYAGYDTEPSKAATLCYETDYVFVVKLSSAWCTEKALSIPSILIRFVITAFVLAYFHFSKEMPITSDVKMCIYFVGYLTQIWCLKRFLLINKKFSAIVAFKDSYL